MKVSEAINKLTVKRDDALHFQKMYAPGELGWTGNESKAIAYSTAINVLEQLDEPQAEKVEAHLAEHWNEDMGDVLWWNFPVEEPPYCGTPLDEHFPKYKTHFSMIDMPTEIEKPKRWVVKNKKHGSGLESFVNSTIKPMWTTEEPLWMTFTDKAKAEAVAVLVEGSVEGID